MTEELPTTLLELLSNPLIFSHAYPYLTIGGLLTLARTSKAFRALIYQADSAFRHLDLSTAKGAAVDIQPIDRGGELWRSRRMDEGVTEEDFYSGPLRGILSSLRRQRLLDNVQTLVLDGQTAASEVLHEIVCSNDYQVQILSLICVKNLNEAKFRMSLTYALRPTRPAGTPKLKGVYIFGTTTQHIAAQPCGVTDSVGAQLGAAAPASTVDLSDISPWYQRPGRVIAQSRRLEDWTSTLQACRGDIAFDAVLCDGPSHYSEFRGSGLNAAENVTRRRVYVDPAIASVALAGCQTCKSMPEGPAMTGEAPCQRLPLLGPPPSHTASIKLAQRPGGKERALYARCTACLAQRCCEGCYKFWCEDCYDGEKGTGEAAGDAGTKRDCWECGRLCAKCTDRTQKVCKRCGHSFCASRHNNGSMTSTCDWCMFSRRRGRELY